MARKDGNRVSEYGEKKMDPRMREDDAGKAPVIPAFDRHSCVEPALDLIGGRNPSPYLFSVIIFLNVQAWQI